jgi:hypothetical protein
MATDEKLIAALQGDLKTLSLETKKKHALVKDVSPNCMPYISNQALYPVIQGCDTRDPKIVKVGPVLYYMHIPYKYYNIMFWFVCMRGMHICMHTGLYVFPCSSRAEIAYK